MKYIKIENYTCKNCGCKEYDVIDLENNIIICADCGTIYEGVFEVIEESEN
jgi:transcription initiation factor TFIIIB Brf1 subunit/transcription initiation factor TFIIB